MDKEQFTAEVLSALAQLENQEDKKMNNELLEALNILEKEKDISKETLLEAIENSLLTACKNHFGKRRPVGKRTAPWGTHNTALLGYPIIPPPCRQEVSFSVLPRRCGKN